ncbi:MAG: serine hydrolase [Alphaproteobacteria bacterium]|nr:serine hydrolase [Alphaproteobacteria bacterium]
MSRRMRAAQAFNPRMDRRSFLIAGAAFALAPRARAQGERFAAAAAYSAERLGVSLLIIERGRTVFEDYPPPGGPTQGWELASGTKSFTGVMAAAAALDRLLAWDEPAAETLPEWRSDPRKARITLRDLLSLTSGIGGPIGRPPTYAQAIDAIAPYERGQRFQYGATPFQIFGEIMRRKTGADPLGYLRRRVFEPLNIAPTHWRRGADGMAHMPQGAGFTARDWSVFGRFVIDGGRAGASQLVDPAALDACFVPSRANPGYGLAWWLLRPGLIPPGPGAGIPRDADLAGYTDFVMAAGAGNQRLYLSRERDLIIVRQARFRGLRRAPRWSDADFLRLVVNA